MEEVMTLEEIQKRFDAEWVLVVDPEFDEHRQVKRGKVVFHSKSRDEIDRKDMELRPKSAAYIYTGTVPENTEFALCASFAG